MKPEPLEPILKMLAALMEHFFPNDGQIFQVISGLLTGRSSHYGDCHVKNDGHNATGYRRAWQREWCW